MREHRPWTWPLTLASGLCLASCGAPDPLGKSGEHFCNRDQECPKTEACSQGVCVPVPDPRCASDEECHGPPPVCRSGERIACWGGACVFELLPPRTPCARANDPEGVLSGVCIDGACLADCFTSCAPPTPFCDPLTALCVECLEAADCEDASACTVGTCDELGECHQASVCPCTATGDECAGSDTPWCVDGSCVECTASEHCPSDGLFCTGAESCDPALHTCRSSGNPCSSPTPFCIESGCVQCTTDGHCPSDGLYCTGEESCNTTLHTCQSSGNPCSDATPGCAEGVGCVECSQSSHCASDGLFCNGVEMCNTTLHTCYSPGDPCSGATSVCAESQGLCVSGDVGSACYAEDECLPSRYCCLGELPCSTSYQQCTNGDYGSFCDDDTDCMFGLYCMFRCPCSEAVNDSTRAECTTACRLDCDDTCPATKTCGA